MVVLSASMELTPRTWYDKLESIRKALTETVTVNEDAGQATASEGSSIVISDDVISRKRTEGDGLLQAAAEAYEKRRESSSDARWLSVVRRSGTAADKVAALTLAIQDDAVANLSNLKLLVGMYHRSQELDKTLC